MRRRTRIGTVLFILPVVVISVTVLYQVYSYYTRQPGVLVINAESSGRFYPAVLLKATVSVASTIGTTPINLSLGEGLYAVTFSPLQWYRTPSSRQVQVLQGKTAYAWGIYSPVIVPIEINPAGFNVTGISVMHAVTPIVWINRSPNFVVLLGDPFTKSVIYPSQNFTFVYPSKGIYRFSISGTSFEATAQVA